MANLVYQPPANTQTQQAMDYSKQARLLMMTAQKNADSMSRTTSISGISGTGNPGTDGYIPNSQNGSQSPGGYSQQDIASLEANTDFQQTLSRMMVKYPGLTKDRLYRVIAKESSFSPSVQNPDTKASGFFQFIPSTAKSLGVTTDQIIAMSPTEQLNLYDYYLDKNGYTGGSLGIMQAAPAFSGRSADTEVYKPGTEAYRLNHLWRGKDGRITVGSIQNFYGY